jgi:thimet oligopeptidase
MLNSCFKFFLPLVWLLAIGWGSTAESVLGESDPTMELIKTHYEPAEITKLTDQLIKSTQAKLDAIAKQTSTTAESLLAFESTMADFSDGWLPMGFMGYVSPLTEIAKESFECENKVSAFLVQTMTRKDLYEAIKKATPSDEHQKVLLKEILESFEENGLKLSEEKLEQVRKLKTHLAEVETHFNQNLNQDQSFIQVGVDDLKGVPAEYVASLTKNPEGKIIVPTKEPDFEQIMDQCSVGETRRKMLEAFENRGMPENEKLFSQAVELRAQIAHLLGYPNWVDFRVHHRMAKSSAHVKKFLEDLKKHLAQANHNDLKLLSELKKQLGEKGDLQPWDVRYYAMQYKKTKLAFDPESVRPYFPAQKVVQGVFDIYSKLLGVKFLEDANVKVWAGGVRCYRVKDAKTDALIGSFFADLYPRPGKYGHAAAFTLHQERTVGGVRVQPVSAIVANFSAPIGTKPSLLKHTEVETFFHEFGHICHQLLTTAEFASLSGTSVDQDFVEAPSQMLENWVYDASILKTLSSNVDHPEQKLPDSLIEQIVKTRNFNQGYFYTRQLLFGLFDLQSHTGDALPHPSELYRRLYTEVMGLPALKTSHFPASFGHLMGGYDAGYYGYLWSKVFAEDMFSLFEKQGLLNETLGQRYRNVILAQGKMKESSELLKEFLGRDVSYEAFYKRLGISAQHSH